MTDHTQCPVSAHTADAASDDYAGDADFYERALCGGDGCEQVVFYCKTDGEYHHLRAVEDDRTRKMADPQPCSFITEPAVEVHTIVIDDNTPDGCGCLTHLVELNGNEPERAAELGCAQAMAQVLAERDAEKTGDPKHCKTCGALIVDGKCTCWALLADALQQYLGRDYDSAAWQAAELWETAESGDKRSVWSGEWPAEHPGVPFYPVYGQPAQTTPAL